MIDDNNDACKNILKYLVFRISRNYLSFKMTQKSVFLKMILRRSKRIINLLSSNFCGLKTKHFLCEVVFCCILLKLFPPCLHKRALLKIKNVLLVFNFEI